MIFECPQCQAKLRGGKPGAVVACGGCSNPVVVPARRTEPPAKPPPDAPVPTTVAPVRGPWGTAALVIGIVGLAHLGLYLLLTMDARSQRRSIEARYDASELRRAKQPDESPAPGTPAFKPWRRAHDLWVASEDYRRHRSHIGLLKQGFLFSFLVQLGITGWILIRVLGKRKKALARAAA